MLDIIKKPSGNVSDAHNFGLPFDGAEKNVVTISRFKFGASVFNLCSLNMKQNLRNTATFLLELGRLPY